MSADTSPPIPVKGSDAVQTLGHLSDRCWSDW
jgi:hypothetical protein